MEGNETTFIVAPQIQESPSRLSMGLGQGASELEPSAGRSSDDENDDGGGDGGDGGDGASMGDLVDWPNEHDNLDAGDSVAINDRLARGKSKKRVKLSKHGIQYTSLPAAVIKRLAQTFANSSGIKGKISSDALNALSQASDWFFEQLGDDLSAYAKHAGRKTINEIDGQTLMKR